MSWPGWDDYVPPAAAPRQAAPAPAAATGRPVRGDRGTRRGAKRVLVTDDRQVVELALAKASRLTGESFQSKREALVWVGRLGQQDRGEIRGLRRQVRFALQAKRPDGLIETVTVYVCDFTYEERVGNWWRPVVEDVKGHLEDVYKLKKRWMLVQYGIEIRETR